MHAYPPSQPPEWAAQGLRFHALSHFLQRRFGRRVWKISVDAGLSCPNLDGKLATEGCIFCDMRSFSPSRRQGGAAHSITEQIAEGVSHLRHRHGDSADTFIAYFQPATNTYGSIDRLLPLWRESLAHPGMVGLIVGTRPDCVSDQALNALAGLAGDTWVSVELGLQSIHQHSLDWLRRAHDFSCFEDAVVRAHGRGLHVGAHLMLGLPGETRDEMLETAEQMARLQVDSVKIHNLYVVRDTPLAALWQRGDFRLPNRDEYVQSLVDFLERLPPNCVIDRIAGDAPPQFLLGPEWCQHKAALRSSVDQEFRRRGTKQGSRWHPPH